MKIFFALIMASILLFGCVSNQPTASVSPTNAPISTVPTSTVTNGGNMVVKGDMVAVWYLGSLEDGTVFDTNIVEEAKKSNTFQAARPYEPLEFQVGAGQMIKGFDQGVVGMKVGETKSVKIAAKDAYGEVRPDLIQQVPIQTLKNAGIDPKVGLKIGTSSGASGVITKVESQNATVDFNHFLAGKTLIFKITIKEIIKP